MPFDIKKLLIVVFVLALPLLTLDMQRNSGSAPWYVAPFYYIGSGVQSSYNGFTQGVKNTVLYYLDIVDVKNENQILKKKLDELGTKVSTYHELTQENDRLRQLLNFEAKSSVELRTAEIIGWDLLFGQNNSILRINKGSVDGIKNGLAVITQDGVVGTTLNVKKSVSEVLVLTDPYSVVDVIVQRSRARGIVEGRTHSTCRLKYLQRLDDVKEGDIVVTSGLGNIFPKGIPVGKVINVDRKNYGITQDVTIIPTVNPFRLEEVFVIIGNIKTLNEKQDNSVATNDTSNGE